MSGNVRDKVQMGVANDACDTGADSLEVDWLDNPVNYTCYHPTTPLLPSSLETIVKCEDLPKDYFPKHFCMNDVLSYNTSIPSYGDHRPIWPKFGEYRYQSGCRCDSDQYFSSFQICSPSEMASQH